MQIARFGSLDCNLIHADLINITSTFLNAGYSDLRIHELTLVKSLPLFLEMAAPNLDSLPCGRRQRPALSELGAND